MSSLNGRPTGGFGDGRSLRNHGCMWLISHILLLSPCPFTRFRYFLFFFLCCWNLSSLSVLYCVSGTGREGGKEGGLFLLLFCTGVSTERRGRCNKKQNPGCILERTSESFSQSRDKYLLLLYFFCYLLSSRETNMGFRNMVAHRSPNNTQHDLFGNMD